MSEAMSDRMSAMAGAASDGIVRVAEAGLRGMVTLKADPDKAAAAVKAVTGQDMPAKRAIAEGAMSLAWMAPDEVLILCDHAMADTVVADLVGRLGPIHHLAVNVSDARAVFTLDGAAAKDVLGKLTPADLSKLAPGTMMRSRIAQVPAAFWISGLEQITLICFRSVAQYAFDLLTTAALPGGEIGYH